MRRQFIVIAILCAAAPLRAQGTQDPVYLRMGGQPGQTNRYQTVVDVFLRGPMASTDTTMPSMRTSRFSTRTVNAVSGDTVTFVDVVDSARMESPSMPQMSQMMAGQAAAMTGLRVTTKMDARARLLSVEIADHAATPQAGPGGRMPGRHQRPMFVLPERPVRAGDSWTDSVVIAGAGPTEGTTNFLATYTLQRIEQRGNFRVAVISMAGNMVTNSPGGPQTMTVVGEMAYDITGRRLATMTMMMNGIMPTPRGDVPVKLSFRHELIA